MKKERLNTEIRQAQIKRAVLDIISREGQGKFSTRNLAATVGISEGAIFRHFKNKNEIIYSIMNDVKEELIENLRILAFSNISAEKRLYAYLCTHIKYLIAKKGITILLFSEAAYMNNNILKVELNEIFTNQKVYINKIVEDGKAEGIWDRSVNADDFSMIYMGIPITLNIEMVLNPNSFHEKDFCKRAILMLERILRKN